MTTTKLLYTNTKTEKENMDALLIDAGIDPRHVSELVYGTVTETPEAERNSQINIEVDPGSILAATNGPWVVAYDRIPLIRPGSIIISDFTSFNAERHPLYGLGYDVGEFGGIYDYIQSTRTQKVVDESWNISATLSLLGKSYRAATEEDLAAGYFKATIVSNNTSTVFSTGPGKLSMAIPVQDLNHKEEGVDLSVDLYSEEINPLVSEKALPIMINRRTDWMTMFSDGYLAYETLKAEVGADTATEERFSKLGGTLLAPTAIDASMSKFHHIDVVNTDITESITSSVTSLKIDSSSLVPFLNGVVRNWSVNPASVRATAADISVGVVGSTDLFVLPVGEVDWKVKAKRFSVYGTSPLRPASGSCLLPHNNNYGGSAGIVYFLISDIYSTYEVKSSINSGIGEKATYKKLQNSQDIPVIYINSVVADSHVAGVKGALIDAYIELTGEHYIDGSLTYSDWETVRGVQIELGTNGGHNTVDFTEPSNSSIAAGTFSAYYVVYNGTISPDEEVEMSNTIPGFTDASLITRMVGESIRRQVKRIKN